MGTMAQHRRVTSNVLWGAANFVSDAMSYYGAEEEGMTPQQRVEIFCKWSHRYERGMWEPNGGTGGVNVYEIDPFQCAPWRAVDDRAPATNWA